MEEIYLKMWKLAKPFYGKGRVYDIEQIEWMVEQAERIVDMININKKILFPLIILHDVGYSAVEEKNPNIKDPGSKRLHMKEGSKIAKKILEQVNYEKELIEKITYYISVHDNWVFGDNSPFKECKEMALFNDLDFLWPFMSFDSFKITAESMKLSPKEFFEFYTNDEKLINRPLCCEETKKMFMELKEKIEKDISNR